MIQSRKTQLLGKMLSFVKKKNWNSWIQDWLYDLMNHTINTFLLRMSTNNYFDFLEFTVSKLCQINPFIIDIFGS